MRPARGPRDRRLDAVLDYLVGEVVAGASAPLDAAGQQLHRVGQLRRRPLGGNGHARVGRLVEPPVTQAHPGRGASDQSVCHSSRRCVRCVGRELDRAGEHRLGARIVIARQRRLT